MTMKLAAICCLLTVAACGGTENNASNNPTNNDTSNNTTPTNNEPDMGGGDDAADPNNMPGVLFADVVTALSSGSCASAGCHLAPGNGTSFVIEGPGGAAEFEAALDGVMTAGGRSLVAAGDLPNSELYLRVTGDGVSRMPFGSTLTPAQITTIGTWISEGASYD